MAKNNDYEALARKRRIKKLQDELNAEGKSSTPLFTPYKMLTYLFVIIFQPYALYRIWCAKSEFTRNEKYVQSALCILILIYYCSLRFKVFG